MRTTKGGAPNPAIKKATKIRRSANVPGQFYGYSIQITRVIAHFLRAHRGQSVSVEHLDDVATHAQTGDLVEQDKSGLAHNPVSDRSPDLWKALANWVRVIRAGALKEDTRFLLYVAQGHHGDLIDRIHGAKTKVDADAVVESVRAMFGGKSKMPNGLSEHVEEVLSASNDVLACLFSNLSLENGSGAPNDDLGAMPGMAAISEAKKSDVLKYLLGWAKTAVDKRIENGQAAVITWDEYHKNFVSAAKKFDRAENMLVARSVDVTEAELQKELRDRTYVRQLQIVQCNEDDMVRAVHDYLRSVTHRTNWSEDGDVIERSFDEFENSLDRAWKSQKSVVEIEQKLLPDAERGQLLFFKCQQLKVPLQGMDVPDFFIPGSFHTMADSLRVGWHPRYKEAVATFVAVRPSQDQIEESTPQVIRLTPKHEPSDKQPAAAASSDAMVEGIGEE